MTEVMERLSLAAEDGFSAVEAAIHLGRYLTARRLCAGKRVLDVACGEGYGSFLMAEWGAAEVHGVDVSADAIARAGELFRSPKLEFSCLDAGRLDTHFPRERFDLIVSLETIEHLHEPVRFLESLAALLAPEGTIVLSCPNDHWYYSDPEQQNPFHVRKYTFAEFREMVESVLGPARGFLLGTPIGGWANWPVDDGMTSSDARSYLAVLRARDLEPSMLVPTAEAVGWDNCSYFLGVWGASQPALLESASVYLTTTPSSEAAVREAQVADLRSHLLASHRKLEDRTRHLGLRGAALQAENELVREELHRRGEQLAESRTEVERQRAAAEAAEAAGRAHEAAQATLVEELERLRSERERERLDRTRERDALEQALSAQAAYYEAMPVVKVRQLAVRMLRRLAGRPAR